LKIVRLDLSDASIASQLLELQREAYRVEADLVGSDDIPPLRETLPELQACAETFLGALADGVLAGAISWKLDGDTIDLHRLVVRPAHFRSGIGVALVRAALAAEPSVRRAIVQTGAANAPAVALYRQEGFEPAGEIEPVPGLRVACFTKLLR
jgi:ribosomal protein S18 acetylase RimI-like enzyme